MEWVLSNESALPRVAMSIVRRFVVLTGRDVVRVGNEGQHVLIHFDETIRSQRLLLLPFDQCLLDLLLEESWFDCVDYLTRVRIGGLTLKRKRRLIALLDSLAGGSGR